jgi:hypothetical protein
LNQFNKNAQLVGLDTELKSQCERNIDYDLSALTSRLHAQYGDMISLILLYGSCLRTNNFTDGVLDFYIIVNNYKDAYKSKFYPLLNELLAPNVFYIEADTGKEILRAKYAVLSEKDYKKGINEWFHSYIWARFAQPVRLIYSKNNQAKNLFYLGLSRSVVRYLNETTPVLGNGRYTTVELWTNALSLSYAAELRPEPEGRSKEIVTESMEDLQKITNAALPCLACIRPIQGSYEFEINCKDADSKKYKRYWQIRSWQGKLLSILRLIKATFTFHDCVEYAVWKINRHTGIVIEITPALKKYPVLLGFKVLWRLLRQKALR